MTTPPSILLIDDDAIVLRMVGRLLQPLGQVRFATSGPVGLQLAAEQCPDLIVLDANMPEMDGFEVLTRLKAQADTRHVPVLFLSGYVDSAVLDQARRLGATDFLVKPVVPVEVLSTVKQHLHSACAPTAGA